MRKYTDIKQWTFLLFIFASSIIFFSASISSLHNIDSTALTISGPSVSNWTASDTTNRYNFTIETNESINRTTIKFNSSFILDNTTLGTSGPDWTCSNTTDTVTCTSPTENATDAISIWFNATSATMTDETVYVWNITTTDLNGSTNSTEITTGVDGKAPQIESENTTATADLNATDSSYVFLTVNVSDSNIASVKINLSSLGDPYSNETDMTKNNTIYYYNLSGNLSLISGLKTLELNLTDSLGHYNDTESIALTISDITKPVVSLTSNQPVNANGTDELIFTATVTDTELNNVTMNLTELGGFGDQQMYNDGATAGDANASDDIWTFNMTVPATFNNGTYDVYVNATDNSSNYNDLEDLSITVVDVTAPYVIDMTATPSTVPANGTETTLTVNVTDIQNISLTDMKEDVFIDLSLVGSSATQNMYDDGGILSGDPYYIISNDTTEDDSIYSWLISIPNTVLSGTYYLNITATDKNGNINDTEYIEINVTDVTIPEAFSVNLSKAQINATGTDTTEITANITDLELDTVYANLSELGGNATQLLTLSSDLYRYTLSVPNSIDNGTYTIIINTTDKSGNYNDSLSIDLNVIDTLAPTITIHLPDNTLSYSNATDLINISTDEPANVTYSIDGGAYISLYNETTNAVDDFPQVNWIENDSHNITVIATDAYGHSTNKTHNFNLRPNLNITDVYLANTSALYTGDTTTINATIATYGFNVSNVTVVFTIDGSPQVPQTYIDLFNTTTSPITIESNFTWNITTSGSHTFSVSVTANNITGESNPDDNTLSNTTFIQDFETNISSELDFGPIAVAGTSTKSVLLTNNAHVNQSAITETITLQKVYNFTSNFTRLETESFYFAVPVNTTAGDITVTLSYNTSLGNITYTEPSVNAPGISELIIDAKTMNQSSLPVNITVTIDLDETQWIGTDFNSSIILENKSSEIFTYNITVPDNVPAGDYVGTLTYTNTNNTITENITFSVSAPELWILSDVVSTPITSSTATYTFYANTERGEKDYSLIIKNNNGGTLSDVDMRFSSLNFTDGNENITIAITNGTDGVTVSGNNASFGDITEKTNKSLILTFNVSNHTEGTYSTTFNVTTSNGEPIENYSVTLQLIITDTLDTKMTHSSVEKLYPANTTTFEMDVSYRDGTPVTGMNSSNITALTIKDSLSNSILLSSSLNNFTETATPGTYLLNITLPSNMVGGNLKLDTTVTSGNYSATQTEDIIVYAPYLSTPVWTSGKTPININIDTFGTGYDTYEISIANNGLEDITVDATLTVCSETYLDITSTDHTKSLTIPAGGSDIESWTVDPKANKTDCTVTVTVTGGKFWFNATTSSIFKMIDLTTASTVTPPADDDDDESTSDPSTTSLSTCDVSACDYDEACVDGACKFISCDDGYYSDHRCIEYIYSIDFTSVPKDLEILQGNTSTIKIKYKNNGTKMIKDFDFTLEGLNEDSSYEILTTLPDKILDDEPQEITIILNISDEAPPGRRDLTINFNSDKVTSSKTFVLAILPDAESIAEIDDWMPVLEDDIDNLKKQFDDIEDLLNGTNYTFVNDTLNRIDILYDELKNATLSGDFLATYEKKAEIERLMAEANALMDETILKQGGTFRYMFTALILILIAIGAYLLYDQSNPKGYHIFEKGNMTKLMQMRLIPFISQKTSRADNNSPQRTTNIHSYHHKPAFEVKLLRLIHILKHKLNLKIDKMHSHQTRLSSDRFTRPQTHHTPKPHPKSTYTNSPKKSQVKITPLGATNLSRKSSVRPVSKMIRSFEQSKTRCGICGKDFKTKYELELHKKYSHR